MAYKIETLPSGSKRIRIYYTDENGNYKTKSVTGKTEKEALKKVLEFEELKKHTESADGITVEEAVKEYIDLNRPVLSPKTTSEYESMLRNRFAQIGSSPVERLTDRSVQIWINGMIKSGLSPKTIRNTYGLFLPAIQPHTQFKPNVSLPQRVEYLHKYPEDTEADLIVDGAKGTPIELPILLAALGGMRMSEIRGLKWEDVTDDYIIVRRAKVYVDGYDEIKTTKSQAGTRYLPIFDPIREALGRTERKGEYIVPQTAASIKRRYNTLLKHLGLPQYRFHDLRHHAASVGQKLGIPDDYMRQYIGHSTVNMLKRYQHQMQTATSKFAGQLNQYYTTRPTNSATNSDTTPKKP